MARASAPTSNPVPTLQPGDIVIADNLGAHKVAGIQRAIQAAGATLWYLPPYSPDLNPIELCFAKLKALVRTARCRSSETLGRSSPVSSTSAHECRNYFRHWGTRSPHGHEKRSSSPWSKSVENRSFVRIYPDDYSGDMPGFFGPLITGE